MAHADGPDPLRPVVVVPDPPPGDHQGLVTVRVLGAPLRVWERSAVHTADLVREFTLLRLGQDDHEAAMPARLLELADDLRARFAGVSDEQNRERLAAMRSGARTWDVTHLVPPEVADACQRLQELLDEADEFCSSGDQLMTLVAPPDQREFRRWYLQEFVRQVHGEDPQPWTGSTD